MVNKNVAPTVNTERDASLKAFEVVIVRDDMKTDACKVLVFDDGHIETTVWTQEELTKTLTEGIVGAVKDAYDRGVFDNV